MTRNQIRDEYFGWLFDLACENRYSAQVSFKKLLSHLHNIEFTYSIPNDHNRAEDGISLRYRFAITEGYENMTSEVIDILDAPCSVLEMMVALSIRCEDWMDDTAYGNRTSQWFWEMIVNLGLGSMTDKRFDERLVNDALERLLSRRYSPDGRGGLFWIRRCDCDLRTVEIWRQMCWYLDSIV